LAKVYFEITAFHERDCFFDESDDIRAKNAIRLGDYLPRLG